MSAWLKRFSLHLAAAVGATGIFVAAAAVGANQTRQQEAVIVVTPRLTSQPATRVPRKPAAPTATLTPVAASPQATAAPTVVPDQSQAGAGQSRTAPERSLAGRLKAVQADSLDVTGVGGREWHVAPAPGALIRLNGRTVKLDALQPGQVVVILGQAEPGQGGRLRFLAHAITARTR